RWHRAARKPGLLDRCCRQETPARFLRPMLIQLSIRDIVLIERLDLAFETGLSVLTGETGAGKSILLDSLSLALGGRGDGGLVRHGEDKGQGTAVFEVGPGVVSRKLLGEDGVSVSRD